jgi:hypothetical protein
MKTRPRFTTAIPNTWGPPGLRDSGFRFEQDGVGGPAGTGGTDDDAAKYAQLQTWLDDQVAGLRGNRDTILGEKRDLERQFNEFRAQWNGLDPESVRNILAKFEGDEEMKLIKDGKFEDVIKMRTENMRKGLEAERDAARDRVTELEDMVVGKDETITVLMVDSQVRELGLAMDPPMDPKGLGDAIRAARGIFRLNGQNEPVALREDGQTPIIGKDGKTPLGIGEWLQTTFETGKTLWWGQSSGGGATGGGEDAKGGKLDADAIEKMSSRQKLATGFAEAE